VRVIAIKSGHALHFEAVRSLVDRASVAVSAGNGMAFIDVREIMTILPHRIRCC